MSASSRSTPTRAPVAAAPTARQRALAARRSARTARATPPTAQQHAVEALRAMILAGELRPGQRVSQDELAQSIGLSVAPVREALRVLQQEGQLTYLPRRGYFVTQLRIEDLIEIYELRRLLEERAARHALSRLDEEALERMSLAARECRHADAVGDVIGELDANRRFHFELLACPDQPHTTRLIGLLWQATEAYRAMYYNSPSERRRSNAAHRRIIAAARAEDADRLVAELDSHRERALKVLGEIIRI